MYITETCQFLNKTFCATLVYTSAVCFKHSLKQNRTRNIYDLYLLLTKMK